MPIECLRPEHEYSSDLGIVAIARKSYLSMAAERGVEVGAAVEVAGLQSDGFPASWSSAVVTKVFDAGTIIQHCVVAYDDVSALMPAPAAIH